MASCDIAACNAPASMVCVKEEGVVVEGVVESGADWSSSMKAAYEVLKQGHEVCVHFVRPSDSGAAGGFE